MKALKENSNFVDYQILRKIILNQVKNVANISVGYFPNSFQGKKWDLTHWKYTSFLD